MNTQININEQFEKECAKVSQLKDKLINTPDFFPIEYSMGQIYDQKTLNTEFDDALSNKKFTIAVCGEVKAGKSTLLNALLFGDNILPTFDTPLTAKLTYIKKSEEPGKKYFQANFYNDEEWESIKTAYSKDNKSKEQFEANLEQSFLKGANKEDCIGKDIVRIDDLNKLSEYVSAPKKGDTSDAGKYTPFVKDVYIYIDDEVLDGLQIVDTPGLNDPNPFNSNETLKWVNNADAVIYIFSNRGCGAFDKQFLIDNMLKKSAVSRIFLLNQVDSFDKQSEILSNVVDEKLFLF